MELVIPFFAVLAFSVAPFVAGYALAVKSRSDEPAESAVVFGLVALVPWLLIALWLGN